MDGGVSGSLPLWVEPITVGRNGQNLHKTIYSSLKKNGNIQGSLQKQYVNMYVFSLYMQINQ